MEGRHWCRMASWLDLGLALQPQPLHKLSAVVGIALPNQLDPSLCRRHRLTSSFQEEQQRYSVCFADFFQLSQLQLEYFELLKIFRVFK